jgi:hypothetical protein
MARNVAKAEASAMSFCPGPVIYPLKGRARLGRGTPRHGGIRDRPPSWPQRIATVRDGLDGIGGGPHAIRQQVRGVDGRANRPDTVIFLSPRPRWGVSWRTTRYPADFLYDNLMIEANIIDAALPDRRRYRQAHLPGVFLHLSQGSPPQPIRRGCAADRAAGADQRMVCDRQDRRDQIVPGISASAWPRLSSRGMPTNLYGLYDNFDLTSAAMCSRR